MQDVISAVLHELPKGGDWEGRIFEAVRCVAAGACAAVFEALDDELLESKGGGMRVVGKRQRTIVTKFGSFKVNRRFYRDKASGSHRFLLDEELGLRARRAATPALEATVLDLASRHPFREVERILSVTSGGVLSHQMIHRIAQEAGARIAEAETIAAEALLVDGELPKSENREAERIFVEADGTMISLQRSDKKKAEIKHVVAYEGWDRVGQEEWKTKNKTIVGGVAGATQTWDAFTVRLLELYRPSALSSLVIGGDGASWIRKGSELFAGSTYQLCRFHIRRNLLRAGRSFVSSQRAYSLALDGDVTGAVAALDAKTKQDKTKIENYLTISAHGLVDYRRRLRSAGADLRGLGAIESNIDKNFANRMKKRGMAWSESGAHHMAKVIQARFNGRLGEGAVPSLPGRRTKKSRTRLAMREIEGSFAKDPGAWLSARMPALTGPHSARPWARALKELTEAKSLAARL